MRAIDTNVLVRLVIGDDMQQVESALEFVEGGVWVSILVLAEAAWVMQKIYRSSSHDIFAAIAMFLDHQSLTIQDSDVVVAALELYRDKPTLGFSDCLILELARKAGHLPLGTFDRALGRVSGAHRI